MPLFLFVLSERIRTWPDQGPYVLKTDAQMQQYGRQQTKRNKGIRSFLYDRISSSPPWSSSIDGVVEHDRSLLGCWVYGGVGFTGVLGLRVNNFELSVTQPSLPSFIAKSASAPGVQSCEWCSRVTRATSTKRLLCRNPRVGPRATAMAYPSARLKQALRRSRRQLRILKERIPIPRDRKSTRLNSSHTVISYAVFCL